MLVQKPMNTRTSYSYDNYILTISEAIQAELGRISTEYNFDNGPEFEIAICEILGKVLPEKYGICRGFAVASNGEIAGDDIFIYDKINFPTLRLLTRGRLDRKEKIPIEAIYAYIEAKNTLDVTTLPTAIIQVEKVKALCSRRDAVMIGQVDPYIVDTTVTTLSETRHYPGIRNPVFGMIFGRNCKGIKGKRGDDVHDLYDSILPTMPKSPHLPDLVVAGPNHFYAPTGVNPDGTNLPTQFYIPDITKGYQYIRRDGISFAAGIIQLLSALDFIRLGRLPWANIINNSRFPQ